MALPSWILVSMSGRRSQHPGPSPTLGSLGPSHQWRHKSRVSLRGPPCAHGVAGTPHEEVRDICTCSIGCKSGPSKCLLDFKTASFIGSLCLTGNCLNLWMITKSCTSDIALLNMCWKMVRKIAFMFTVASLLLLKASRNNAFLSRLQHPL